MKPDFKRERVSLGDGRRYPQYACANAMVRCAAPP